MRRKSDRTGVLSVANLTARIANLPAGAPQSHRKSARTHIDTDSNTYRARFALWITLGRSRLGRGSAGGLLPPDPRGCAPGRAFARPAPRWFSSKTQPAVITERSAVNPLPGPESRLGRGLTGG